MRIKENGNAMIEWVNVIGKERMENIGKDKFMLLIYYIDTNTYINPTDTRTVCLDEVVMS